MTREEKAIRNAEIVRIRKSGTPIKDISEAFGVTETTVHRILKDAGVLIGDTSEGRRRQKEAAHRTVRLQDGAKYISRFNIPFEYVGGYTGTNGHAVLRCMKCGTETDFSITSLRNGWIPHCPNCDAIAREERKKQKQIERERTKKTAQEERERNKLIREAQKEAERESKKRIAICVECGEQFTTYKQHQVCCSSECSRKRQNNHKDRRLKKVEYVDKSITLQSLYKRDGGVCYICGKKCNLEDYIVRDGTTICGDYYPSIDHVKPVSKGGSHSWDNIRLAHRGCNIKKRNYDYAVNPQSGQMMFV